MADEVAIRQAEEHEMPDLIELAGRALGWEPSAPNGELFGWKHRENPFGPSPIWLAEVGGDLAGFRAMLRWELCDPAGGVHQAVRAVDTATDPRFQGRGIFTRLTRHALESLQAQGVGFVFNTPNSQSRPGYLKMGWFDVGRPEPRIVPDGPRGVLRLVTARTAAEKWSLPTDAGWAAADVLDSPAAAALVAGLGRSPGWSTHRTPAWLAWRHRFQPLHYRVLAHEGDVARGVVVFRRRRRGGAVECTISELLVPGGDRRVRRSLLSRLRSEVDADYHLALGRDTQGRRWIPLRGQGPRLTARRITEDPPDQLARWSLSLGDIELF